MGAAFRLRKPIRESLRPPKRGTLGGFAEATRRVMERGPQRLIAVGTVLRAFANCAQDLPLNRWQPLPVVGEPAHPGQECLCPFGLGTYPPQQIPEGTRVVGVEGVRQLVSHHRLQDPTRHPAHSGVQAYSLRPGAVAAPPFALGAHERHPLDRRLLGEALCDRMRQLEGVVSLVDPAGVRAPEKPARQLEYGLIQRLLRHAAGSADGERRAGEAGVDVLYALALDRELQRDAVYVDGPGRSRHHEVSVASRGRVLPAISYPTSSRTQMTGRGDLRYRSFEHELRQHGSHHSSGGCEASLTQSLATPALARCSSERAYFITWERSECPISSASSLTCPGLACKNQVPNVRLRSWGFISAFFMPLFLTQE